MLILGASARAAAFSALRAGLRPTCGDLFADRDLAAVADVRRVEAWNDLDGLEDVAASAPPGPWIYTGGLENLPELVDRLAAARQLWGVCGDTLRAVRDPFVVAKALEAAGLPCPAVRATADGLPRDGTWLAKPIGSAGGEGIRALGPDDSGWPFRSYYQRYVDGKSLAALFVGDGRGATLIGVTRQLLGRPGAPFAYVGSIGPCRLRRAFEDRVAALGQTLVREFGLVGLFGVDFILNDGLPWPVEVNPRFTASVENMELALGRPLLDDHRRACDSTAPRAPIGLADGPRPRVVGRAVVFAEGPCRFPEIEGWKAPDPSRFEVPEVADVPQPGSKFEAGEPVLTVFATGHNLRDCEGRLGRTLARWRQHLIIL
ncbi:MAG TPA: ATP-grasp domain-containing protein [Isosphaeraceae bacterium]|nr:ATP-grasp domain-containing protein [Isosphaeraceae bacterium]